MKIYLQKFSYSQIAESVELPGAFMIGAGAGPCHVVGVNSEVHVMLLHSLINDF